MLFANFRRQVFSRRGPYQAFSLPKIKKKGFAKFAIPAFRVKLEAIITLPLVPTIHHSESSKAPELNISCQNCLLVSSDDNLYKQFWPRSDWTKHGSPTVFNHVMRTLFCCTLLFTAYVTSLSFLKKPCFTPNNSFQ